MITLLVVVAAALLYAVRRRYRRHQEPGTRTRTRGRLVALLAVIAILGLQAVIGSPASAQDSCEAPNPERPGDGMVGAIDEALGQGQKDSPYNKYGYAGMVWHTYDSDCGPLPSGLSDPDATVGNWLGNLLFNVGKNIVGATNSLHYTLLNGGVLGGLNDEIGAAADAVFNNIFAQLFGLFMVVLAVLLFRQIWQGDFATVSKRGLFALGGMWLAASTLVLVSNYERVDDLIVTTTTNIQAGFVDPQESRLPGDVLPTELHTRVVYENWLRGEFGRPDSPQAEQFGPRLLADQAWTFEDIEARRDADDAAEQAKKDDYKKLATELGPATGYFNGTDGSRVGAGLLSLLQSIFYALFQLFAKLAVLLAQLLLRILTLAAPVIGLVAIVNHDILRRVGRAVGAVVLNVLILAILAGIHFKFLQLIFGEGTQLSLLTQMLLAAIVTLVFFLVGRPVRRMWQMIELSVGAAGAAMPAGGGGFWSWLRRRKSDQPNPHEVFWDNVRGAEVSEDATAVPAGRRPRPEAGHPVTATAERLDTRTGITDGGTQALPGARPQIGPGTSFDPAMPHGGPSGGYRGSAQVLVPTGTASRVVDTVPVTDRGWDRGEDAIVVPSRVSVTSRGEAGNGRPAPAAPRPADVEMVAGRPVHVVYRPSRGLEVRDGSSRRMPLKDSPRYTDSVVEGVHK